MVSPVQIILNQTNFEEVRDKQGGGSKRDFFAFRDAEFRQHKVNILDQMNAIGGVLASQSQGNIGVIKVILRREAWAKSHRPTNTLFRNGRIPLIGGADLGEMLFEATPHSIDAVAQAIARAETSTKLKLNANTQKEVPNPSSFKSELGAISRVELYGAPDRRDFSVEEAITWLSNPLTGSGYLIELFESPIPRTEWDRLPENRQQLHRTFREGLSSFKAGLDVHRLTNTEREQPQFAFRLERSDAPSKLLLTDSRRLERSRVRELAPFDPDVIKHQKLLNFLENHPLVRRIELPPIITRTATGLSNVRSAPSSLELPTRQVERSHPIMGIVDGGVAPVLNDWVQARWDILADEHMDLNHGTFIGGLAVAGNTLNGEEVCAEPDGIELVDIAVFPDESSPDAFQSYYPSGLPDFFDEVDQAIGEYNSQFGARVYNFSLNVQHSATPNRYGPFAMRLDSIAETNDCIFFISAGNTAPQNVRAEWSSDPTQALVDLAAAREDSLLMPGESVRNIAVAAVNPPDVSTSVAHAPANYSRRGPGLRAGVKPDIAHVGGTGTPCPQSGHGLYSILPNGNICDGCGTSYAAPLAAKTAAILDHSIEGDVSRETLHALLLHNAALPESLKNKTLRPVAKDLVGFGIPPSAQQILGGTDNEITLVFASRLQRDQQIEFGFSWPESLSLEGGKCKGHAKLTLVSTPPLDSRFGSEFVRVNLNATLQQEDFDRDGKAGWKGRLEPVYLPDEAERRRMEAERIEHDLKWSPVKVFEKHMPRGVGKSTNWRLFVEYLTRSGEDMPINGIPFTAILTISDANGEARVFDEMRRSLQATGVQISDIQTAARVTPRI